MNDTDDVTQALELLLEEFDRARDDLKERARAAVSADSFNDARTALDKAEGLDDLTRRVHLLITDWADLGIALGPGVAELDADVETESGARAYLGRVQRGLRTPEEAFRIPILRALVEFGGTADIGEVLDHVESQLKDALKPVDFEGLKSDADTIRWRNTAQWSRNELVKRGLMEPSRERGVWEISAQGREWLDSEVQRDE